MQEYDVRANWKLLVENSVDDYHLVTHARDLAQLHGNSASISPCPRAMVLPTQGRRQDLGNGHFTTDNSNFRGRPVANVDFGLWRRGEGRDRGDPRASWSRGSARRGPAASANTNRNLMIFPNLVIRRLVGDRAHFFPDGPGKMHVIAWALGPSRNRKRSARAACDASSRSSAPAASPRPTTSTRSSGAAGLRQLARGAAGPTSRAAWAARRSELNSDEHLRVFWRRWHELMELRA